MIPGQGTKAPHAVQHGQKEREKKEATVSDSVDLGEGQGDADAAYLWAASRV